MQTVKSRVYTNTILTAIAILLAVIALRPFTEVASSAYAERGIRTDRSNREGDRLDAERGAQQRARLGDDTAKTELLAEAQREIARATSEVAAATRESANAQREIAKAIAKLGSL